MMPVGGRRNWPLLACRYLRTPRFSPLKLCSENRTVAGFNLVYLWHRTELFSRAFESLFAGVGRGELRPVVGQAARSRHLPRDAEPADLHETEHLPVEMRRLLHVADHDAQVDDRARECRLLGVALRRGDNKDARDRARDQRDRDSILSHKESPSKGDIGFHHDLRLI